MSISPIYRSTRQNYLKLVGRVRPRRRFRPTFFGFLGVFEVETSHV
jgi:hypothetical protein